jgi:hypothetical protein
MLVIINIIRRQIMEKEKSKGTTGTEGFSFGGCGSCCGGMPATEEKREEKRKEFMDCGDSTCIPEDMGKMWKDKGGVKSFGDEVKKRMRDFFRTEKQKV